MERIDMTTDTRHSRTHQSLERGLRAIDGLLTGFHEPRSSHLAMLAALAGYVPLRKAYAEAHSQGYLWHEFGDLHLILP